MPAEISGESYIHVSRYMDRFKLDCWARVIHKVIQFAGPCLDGWMSRFNDPAYLVLDPLLIIPWYDLLT